MKKMELILKRTRFGEEITTGQLYIDGAYFCFTLEDKVREPVGLVQLPTWKVPLKKVKHETAIPQGIYDITFEHSPKFGPETLTINKVPGFTDIRIHAGNYATDTSGCIIVGYRIHDSGVIVPGTTRQCLVDLKQQVRRAEGPVKIRVF